MTSNNPLSKLTNQELELRLKDLASKERKLLHVILEHIKELEIRKLYLEKAYSSVFEYLVKELGYSNSAAMRRIEAARLLRDVPLLAQKIQEGSLNLSQIGELSRAVKEKEKITGLRVSSEIKNDLVFAISNKTTQETQKELALALDIPTQDFEKQRLQQDQSLRLEISLSKEQLEKFKKCKDLAAHLLMQNFNNEASWATLFEVLADQYLDKKKMSQTPSKRIQKTSKSSIDLATVEGSDSSPSNPTSIAASAMTARIYKKVTPFLKRTVLIRDGGCQYLDPVTGNRCHSKFGLEVDHKTSQWAGGDHSLTNLQALCRQHNNFKYAQESGFRFLT